MQDQTFHTPRNATRLMATSLAGGSMFTPEVEERVLAVVRVRGFFAAIEEIQSATGCDLERAKTEYDRIVSQHIMTTIAGESDANA